MIITASARVIFVLLAASLLALAITGSPVYSRLSYLWIFLLLGNWVWAASSLRGIAVRREARTLRAQVGQVFEERFEIENASRLPRLWLEVRDLSTLPNTQGSHVLTLVAGRRTRSYRAINHLTRRGVFPLGPTAATSGDPFGMFLVSRAFPAEASLLVYPMMFEVRSFPGPAGLLPGGEALRRRTHQITANASGVREYAPGDSVNRIHWVSTARRGRLMVKEFELDPLAQVWIFVDAFRGAQAALPHDEPAGARDFWGRPVKIALPPSTEEYAISIAASLARYFVRRRRAVGLVSNGESLRVLPPEPGGRQLGKMLEALALLQAEGDLNVLAVVLAQAQHLPRGSTVILITPSTHRRVAVAVEHLLRRGQRPVAVLLDSATFGGPLGTESLAATVAALGVPVRVIANGDNLESKLNMPDPHSSRTLAENRL